MRILLTHPHYAPDTAPYGVMLAGIAAALVADGHAVTVLTAQPSYNRAAPQPALPRRDRQGTLTVLRVRGLPAKTSPLRHRLGLLRYALQVLTHGLWRRRSYDVISVSTMPPVVMGVVARIIRRVGRVPFVYHLMDVHPEVLAGVPTRTPRPIRRWLRRRDTITCRRADAVVVPSADMARTVEARGIAPERIAVIPHFLPEHDTGQHPPFDRGDARLVLVFAGNLGRFQGLDTVLGAARRLTDDPGIRFVFLGAGSARDHLAAAAGDLVGHTVHLLPHLPLAEALAVMAHGDVGIVSLHPGVIRAAFPSKTVAYLAAGLEVLATVEADSAVAAWIDTHGAGVHCPPGDPAALAAAIRTIDTRPRPDRATLRALGEEHFGRAAALAHYLDLYRTLAAAGEV